MRAALAGLLGTLAVVAAALAAAFWVTGWDTLNATRFADATVSALATDPGEAVVTEHVVQSLAAFGVPVPGPLRGPIRSAVSSALRWPPARRAMAATLEHAHPGVLTHPDRPVAIQLAPIRAALLSDLRRVSPALAALVPTSLSLGEIRVVPADVCPLLTHAPGAARALRWLPWASAAAALVLGALAVLATLPGRRRGAVRLLGAGVLAVAAVAAILRPFAPGIARRIAEGGDTRRLAAELALRYASGWWIAALVLGIVGLALVAATLVRPRAARPAPAPERGAVW